MILSKRQKTIALGNLEAYRDWGYAPEYVEVMWKMMQGKNPDDYVIGTGETHSVKEFLNAAIDYAGLDISLVLRAEEEMIRPSDVHILKAGTDKAKLTFGWNPKIRFRDLVKIMIDADLRNLDMRSIGEGDEILRKAFPNRWWRKD
jgi:GDPmannose 4,6-dehydratase